MCIIEPVPGSGFICCMVVTKIEPVPGSDISFANGFYYNRIRTGFILTQNRLSNQIQMFIRS